MNTKSQFPSIGMVNTSQAHLIQIAILGLAVCATAISSESYWIDEAGTAVKAMQPMIGSWWHLMSTDRSSDLQMPLYMLFTWGWEKLTGLNEYIFRAGNVLWFLSGLLATAKALKGALRWTSSLVILTSPFAWYYLNEARPYAMQFGAAFVVLASLYELGVGQNESFCERCWVIAFCLGSLSLAASSLLAMLWLGAYWAAATFSTPKSRLQQLAKKYWAYWAITLLLLFFVGLYYLWTLSLGARATGVGGTDAKNFVFIFYELLGFTGLGPGRLAIRADGLAAFRPWWPELSLYGLTILVVLSAGWRQTASGVSLRARWCWSLAFALAMAFIMMVGIAVRFRVLGRHCAPILPLGVLVLGTGVAELLKNKNWWGRLVVVIFFGFSLASCFSLRFCERHAKDDYRGAATIAKVSLAHGERVWWDADETAAVIYHVPLATNPDNVKAAYLLANPTRDSIASPAPPDVIIASKPDLFDSHGALAEMVAQEKYKIAAVLPAFVIWAKADRQVP